MGAEHAKAIVKEGGKVVIADIVEEDWNRILDTNVSGAFRGIKSAIAGLKKSAPSSITNISSTAGIKGFAGASGYCAAKFAIRGLTKSFAFSTGAEFVIDNGETAGQIIGVGEP